MEASSFVDIPSTLAAAQALEHTEVALNITDGTVSEYTVDEVPALDDSAMYATESVMFKTSRETVSAGKTYTISASAEMKDA